MSREKSDFSQTDFSQQPSWNNQRIILSVWTIRSQISSPSLGAKFLIPYSSKLAMGFWARTRMADSWVSVKCWRRKTMNWEPLESLRGDLPATHQTWGGRSQESSQVRGSLTKIRWMWTQFKTADRHKTWEGGTEIHGESVRTPAVPGEEWSPRMWSFLRPYLVGYLVSFDYPMVGLTTHSSIFLFRGA